MPKKSAAVPVIEPEAAVPEVVEPEAPKLAPNEVPLKLAGADVVLRANFKRAIPISSAYGGLLPALERIRGLDIAAMTVVVNFGLGRASTKIQQTQEEIGRSNLIDVMAAAAAFLSFLIAGPTKAEG